MHGSCCKETSVYLNHVVRAESAGETYLNLIAGFTIYVEAGWKPNFKSVFTNGRNP